MSQITTRNPQANAILERTHQTIGNMIRTWQLPTRDDVEVDDPFTGLLTAIAHAVRSTVHTTMGATPSQLVFGRDSILNKPFTPDWDKIREKKQKLINENNKKENEKRIEYQYNVGDKIMLKTEDKTKYGRDQYEGPYVILRINNDNGTVRFKKNSILDTVNIRNIHPYKE